MFLNEYLKKKETKKAIIPIGTLEWHGNHLPIETDVWIAEKISEILARKSRALLLPSIYLGSDREHVKNGKKLIGMDFHVGKKLDGNLYYLKPKIFYGMVSGLADNLCKQGFKDIYIVTGHGGSKHIEMLLKIADENKSVKLINPYDITDFHIHHADEFETSLLWACRPEQEKISRCQKIAPNDDFFAYRGYDPRKKSNLGLGKKILAAMIDYALKIIG